MAGGRGGSMGESFSGVQGKYELLARLGGGGMGETWLVRHRHLDQARVVKVMRPELTGDADLRERFLREARIASRIEHPRIARLHDFEVAPDGTAFLVLEYVPGYSLAELARLPGAGPLGAAAAAEAGLAVTEALQHLHAAGFLHRDVSPDNVLACLDERGAAIVKLIDLGIAKALKSSTAISGTRGDVFLGKPLYASPEQIRTEPLGPTSDFYSLGAMLYELATGVFPFRYTNLASLLAAHLEAAPLPFSESDSAGRVPEPLRATLLRLLDKDPSRRLDSADRLAIALALASGDAGPAALAARVRAATAALGDRAAARRSGVAPDPALQARFDSRFRGPTGGGVTEVSGVAPTLLLGSSGESAPPPVPHVAAPAAAGGAAVVATWVGRTARRLPWLGSPRARLAAASLLGGAAFFLLFMLLFWVVGRTPGGDPWHAVLESLPASLRYRLGLASGSGWRHALALQLGSIATFLPGLAAGAAGAQARRRGWPGWLRLLLSALAAFLFVAPFLPPFGSDYRQDPFPLVAVAYLGLGALSGRLAAWLDVALERR